MKHLSEQEIVALAMKVDENTQIEGEELSLANHVFECKECQNKFAICMNSLKFLKPESLDEFFKEKLEYNQVAEEVEESQDESLLYRMRIVVDTISNSVKCLTDMISEGLPRFEVAKNYAFARGGNSGEMELVADESIIVFDKEEGTLTISLDEEVYGKRNLVAYLETDGQVRKREFISDGRGMTEAYFEGVNEEMEMKISIEVAETI